MIILEQKTNALVLEPKTNKSIRIEDKRLYQGPDHIVRGQLDIPQGAMKINLFFKVKFTQFVSLFDKISRLPCQHWMNERKINFLNLVQFTQISHLFLMQKPVHAFIMSYTTRQVDRPVQYTVVAFSLQQLTSPRPPHPLYQSMVLQLQLYSSKWSSQKWGVRGGVYQRTVSFLNSSASLYTLQTVV